MFPRSTTTSSNPGTHRAQKELDYVMVSWSMQSDLEITDFPSYVQEAHFMGHVWMSNGKYSTEMSHDDL